jgi:hypothetical protein
MWDININYLESNSKKLKLEEMLNSYNLKDTVYFPTRITNNSATLIDNIFVVAGRATALNRVLTDCLIMMHSS